MAFLQSTDRYVINMVIFMHYSNIIHEMKFQILYLHHHAGKDPVFAVILFFSFFLKTIIASNIPRNLIIDCPQISL